MNRTTHAHSCTGLMTFQAINRRKKLHTHSSQMFSETRDEFRYWASLYTLVAALCSHTRLRANTEGAISSLHKQNWKPKYCSFSWDDRIPSSPINPLSLKATPKKIFHNLKFKELLHNCTLQSVSPWCYPHIHIQQHIWSQILEKRSTKLSYDLVSNLTYAGKLNNTWEKNI